MNLIKTDEIHSKIFTIRGKQVMLDRDLAVLYNVQTKVLNQAVKRNKERFPENFSFQLRLSEKNELVTNCDRLANLKHATVNPFVFTEQGVAMLSAVLRSETAIQVSIQIIETFVKMRNEVVSNSEMLTRLLILENKLVETDKTVNKILQSFDENPLVPAKGIFFEGQLFDAYVFTVDLIKSAKKSIILIDNYVDETTLLMLSKRDENCQAIIYTHKINAQLQLDLVKYNEQYPTVEIKHLKLAHDRFLIIDQKELYHFGASIKDLGKKWFAFSRIDEFLPELLSKLNNSQND
jgi:hypothetical protein